MTPYHIIIFPAQAIDSIHQVGLYCLALVPANTLPKTPLGGIHICETKQNFLEGNLHPCNILMCPHTCVTNLPKPRQKQPGRSPKTIPTGVYIIIIITARREYLKYCHDLCHLNHYLVYYIQKYVTVQITLIVSDLFSGCRPSFHAGRQLGGGETDRSGYRQRAGCGGGPGSDPKGTEAKSPH